jgi:endonuclease YncB( thermonuclease family)
VAFRRPHVNAHRLAAPLEATMRSRIPGSTAAAVLALLMRIWIVALSAIALAGLFVAGSVVLGYRWPASAPPAAVAALAPPPPSVMPAPTPPAEPTLPPPAEATSPPQLAEAPAPDLPTVEVASRPEHVVPDYDSPPRPVTLKDRDRSADVAARGAPRVATQQVPSPQPQSPAVTINGKARVGDGVSLMVQGRAVALFGVRAPRPGDRCTVSARLAPRACDEVAREVLASRLDVYGTVSCRMPPDQRGAPAAICLDSTGIDLGGFLVAEGFGLADAAQSRDYVGAESLAASLHRGLWRFR